MTTQSVIDSIASSAEQAGMKVVRTDIGGRPAVVARTSKFRLRWFATKLHAFLVATAFPANDATTEQMDAFMRAASDYAKANKGGLPGGLQTGTAAIAVVVTDGTSPEVDDWATPHGSRWAAIAYPVLADVGRRSVAQPKRLIIGAVYGKYLGTLVQSHVEPAVQKSP